VTSFVDPFPYLHMHSWIHGRLTFLCYSFCLFVQSAFNEATELVSSYILWINRLKISVFV
jgi:hypothetical protein